MKKLVIYHNHCSDGWAAAWLFARSFPDAELFPASYGDEPPDVRGRDVFVVDFSYSRAIMLRLIEQARGNVTVLDHHASAEKELTGICETCYRDNLDILPSITFDMKKSGSRLAWEYLNFVNAPVPWLVDYTEDRDLWKWEMPFSREVNAAIRSRPQTIEEWNELHHRTPMSLVPEGAAVLRDQAQTVAAHAAKAWEVEIDGHKVMAVNATTMISEIAGELAAGKPFGATFQIVGNKVVWSLRRRDGDLDLSVVAKKMGGGGHPAAAGYSQELGK